MEKQNLCWTEALPTGLQSAAYGQRLAPINVITVLMALFKPENLAHSEGNLPSYANDSLYFFFQFA
jgi:hypothetical protein